jgi:hypothetical protein
MKKTGLLFATGLLAAMLTASCSKETPQAVFPAAPTAVFAKTPEMLGFEAALKKWMQAKQESQVGGIANTAAEQAEQAANTLLVSIGKQHMAQKPGISTDELMRTALQEYSKKLTEMYNQQKH